MKSNSKLLLCSAAALTLSLAATACASRRTTATGGTAAPGTTTTAGTTPRTDNASEVRQAGVGDQAERLQEATTALQQIMNDPDKGVPQELLDRAQCIVMVPHMKKGAFVVGAQYGVGFMSCRASGAQGWTAPATVRIEGGSIGFQIGGQETDLLLLVMNKQGQDRLLQSQFQIGGDASVAAGPVGRTVSASTDAYMTAEMLAYSQARGVFAGVSLKGTTIREDMDENRQLYGRELTNRDIIEGKVAAPPAAQGFIGLLTKLSPAQKS